MFAAIPAVLGAVGRVAAGAAVRGAAGAAARGGGAAAMRSEAASALGAATPRMIAGGANAALSAAQHQRQQQPGYTGAPYPGA